MPGTGAPKRCFDGVDLQVLWQSIISTVNEQATALQRSAFSPIVREAGDLANGLFDPQGRMVAQAVTGTPGHINSLAMGVVAVLAEHPVESLSPGDVLITNDPYKTCGQLLDVTVMTPVFRGGRLIAFFCSTIHHSDVGGYGIGAGGRDVFEEGLWIPICKLMVAGERNTDVWNFILSNVRTPDHVAGDLHAQMASAAVGAERLQTLCDAWNLDDIDDLADEIIERSEAATRESIRALPPATHEAEALLDLADGSLITIRCAVTVYPDLGEIVVSYEGSSDASPWGINVVRNYTHAYTTFTVRSMLNPEIPNNHGSLAPIRLVAPEGSIVNAVSPQPCTARHVVGMFLPNALLKALAPRQALSGDGRGVGCRVDHAGERLQRRRQPVYHGHVHLRRRSGGTGLQAGAVGLLVPHGGGCGARGGGGGFSTHPFPAQGVAGGIRRRRAPAGRRGSDDRVRGGHRPGVAVERRHQPAHGRAPGT